jgi:hypothetical protein
MKILHKIITYPLFATISAAFFIFIFPTVAYGLSAVQQGALAAKGKDLPLSLFGKAGVFTTVSNAMLFIVGALSVVMLIFGGLKYVISGGNASAVTSAKNTVLYAIIGLVVALLAYSAINFVLTILLPGSAAIKA